MVSQEDLKSRIKAISEKIQKACDKAGRKPETVKTMVVTKNNDFDVTRIAYEQGFRLFGENRVQEALEKYGQNHGLDLDLHMIGHLQSNKAKIACELSSCIQSIDKVKTLREVQKQADILGKIQNIMIQVNTSGEASKFGVKSSEALWPLIDTLADCGNVKITGLMTIGPFDAPEKEIRSCFETLRELRLQAAFRYPDLAFPELSMGMSDDFQWAIEEGATIIRLGRALLGDRYA